MNSQLILPTCSPRHDVSRGVVGVLQSSAPSTFSQSGATYPARGIGAWRRYAYLRRRLQISWDVRNNEVLKCLNIPIVQ